MFFKEEFHSIESLIPNAGVVNHKISKSGIGWHLDHMLKSIILTCKHIKKSNPDDYKWKFNLARLYVLSIGSFPRGSAKAPKAVVAKGEVMEDDLHTQLKEAKSHVAEILNLHPKSNFQHPYFGLINLRETQRFIKVHTNHHLKIIKDIIDQ